MSTRGSGAKLRASATRWRSPPGQLRHRPMLEALQAHQSEHLCNPRSTRGTPACAASAARTPRCRRRRGAGTARSPGTSTRRCARAAATPARSSPSEANADHRRSAASPAMARKQRGLAATRRARAAPRCSPSADRQVETSRSTSRSPRRTDTASSSSIRTRPPSRRALGRSAARRRRSSTIKIVDSAMACAEVRGPGLAQEAVDGDRQRGPVGARAYRNTVAPNSPSETAKANPAAVVAARETIGRSTSIHARPGDAPSTAAASRTAWVDRAQRRHQGADHERHGHQGVRERHQPPASRGGRAADGRARSRTRSRR